MAKNLDISGVGGWLGFLVFVLTIFGPLIGFGSLSQQMHDTVEQFPQLAITPQWQTYKQVVWVIFTVSATIGFAAGYRLWKIHFPESVRFAILALWLGGPVASMLMAIYIIIIFGSNIDGGLISEMAGTTISSCIAAGIWTAYLMRSVRVRNTYKLPHSSHGKIIGADGFTNPNTQMIDSGATMVVNGFNPFRCNTKVRQRLSVGILIASLLLWFFSVGVMSNVNSDMGLLELLIIFGIPIAVYLAVLVALAILRKASKSEGRLLLSVSIMWIFSTGAWGYIWNWENVFRTEEYIALFGLPLIGTWLGFFLWRWSKTG